MMFKVVKCVELVEMPFDKVNEENQFVHATGNYCLCSDGLWRTEYEDSDFVYADNCVYETEEVEEDYIPFDWEED